jgi:hypothetical protein
MIRIAISSVVLAALGACGSTPEPRTPQQMIMGKWTCETESENITISGVFDYQANGLAQSQSSIGVDAGAVKIALTANADSTWGFGEDGKMTEMVTAMRLISATMAGQPMPTDMVESLVQPKIDGVVGQSSTSTVVFGENSFTSTTDEDIVTTCKR